MMRFLFFFLVLISSLNLKAQCDGCRISLQISDCNLFVYDSSSDETFIYNQVRSYNESTKVVTLVNNVGGIYNLKHENVSKPNLPFGDFLEWLESNLIACSNGSSTIDCTDLDCLIDQDTFGVQTCFIATSDGTGYLEGQEIQRTEWFSSDLSSPILIDYEVLSTGLNVSPNISDLIGCNEQNSNPTVTESLSRTQGGTLLNGSHIIASGSYSLEILNAGITDITIQGETIKTGQKWSCHKLFDYLDSRIDYCEEISIFIPSGGEAWYIALYPNN